MGKFILGLIVGIVVAVLAMSYDPNLPQEVRASLADLTAAVMRGTERAAESVGEAANQVADEVEPAGGEPESEGRSPAQ
jgi:hypothetical protein